MFSTVNRVARIGGAHRAAIGGLFLLISSWLVVSVLFGTDPASAQTACSNSPTITWVGNSSTEPDSWHTASNWDLNRVPQAGDHVCIPDVADTDGITFSTGTTSIASLESTEHLTVSAGTLELTSTTQGSKTSKLTLSGGTLSGAGNLTIPAGGPLDGPGAR
jgi:hypothetical protein